MLDVILMHRRETGVPKERDEIWERETGVPKERDEIWERETKNLLSIFSRELC
jgi:hypothetical protein